MGSCNIDHTHEDVVKKFESQEEFLPKNLSKKIHRFLQEQHSQEMLNKVFHLLKKYDLASESEQQERNNQFELLIK